jgi:hypothetical protein
LGVLSSALAYCEKPTPKKRTRLEAQYDKLFATHTGYYDLDQRIEKTRAYKVSLLQVLEHPEFPLHNNASELAIRQRVRKMDLSFGPRAKLGLQGWDPFMTLADTCRKLQVRFYAYIHNRVSQTKQISSRHSGDATRP